MMLVMYIVVLCAQYEMLPAVVHLTECKQTAGEQTSWNHYLNGPWRREMDGIDSVAEWQQEMSSRSSRATMHHLKKLYRTICDSEMDEKMMRHCEGVLRQVKLSVSLKELLNCLDGIAEGETMFPDVVAWCALCVSRCVTIEKLSGVSLKELPVTCSDDCSRVMKYGSSISRDEELLGYAVNLHQVYMPWCISKMTVLYHTLSLQTQMNIATASSPEQLEVVQKSFQHHRYTLRKDIDAFRQEYHCTPSIEAMLRGFRRDDKHIATMLQYAKKGRKFNIIDTEQLRKIIQRQYGVDQEKSIYATLAPYISGERTGRDVMEKWSAVQLPQAKDAMTQCMVACDALEKLLPDAFQLLPRYCPQRIAYEVTQAFIPIKLQCELFCKMAAS